MKSSPEEENDVLRLKVPSVKHCSRMPEDIVKVLFVLGLYSREF